MSLTYLVESTVIDTYKYDFIKKKMQSEINLPRTLRIDNYYSLSNRTRCTIIEAVTQNTIFTSALFFKNAV